MAVVHQQSGVGSRAGGRVPAAGHRRRQPRPAWRSLQTAFSHTSHAAPFPPTPQVQAPCDWSLYLPQLGGAGSPSAHTPSCRPPAGPPAGAPCRPAAGGLQGAPTASIDLSLTFAGHGTATTGAVDARSPVEWLGVRAGMPREALRRAKLPSTVKGGWGRRSGARRVRLQLRPQIPRNQGPDVEMRRYEDA